MKSLLLSILLISTQLNAQVSDTTELPFTKGVNLTNWFQAGSSGSIDFSKYTYEDFVDIKSLGVDVIRVPINLHSMTQGAPDYTLDPLFLFSWIRWSIGRKNWIFILYWTIIPLILVMQQTHKLVMF